MRQTNVHWQTQSGCTFNIKEIDYLLEIRKKLDKYVVEKPEYNIDKPMMTDFIIERSRLLCGAYFIVSKDTKVL